MKPQAIRSTVAGVPPREAIARDILGSQLKWHRVSYEDLATAVNKLRTGLLGVEAMETPHAMLQKVGRGTYSLAFFLELSWVLPIRLPAAWVSLSGPKSALWAAQILRYELAARDLTYARYADLLRRSGMRETANSIALKAMRGTYRMSFVIDSDRALVEAGYEPMLPRELMVEPQTRRSSRARRERRSASTGDDDCLPAEAEILRQRGLHGV
ncbi:hypothetical protein CTP10_R46390 [Cupriavidus sp. P-10]|uniref:DUF6471 domain-containing protein n=1 Tax=Cupriavidus sp. P-10 TaxID=2027911 RepID=UPI000E2F986B|nr:DUF6471 domain-containing protein [Cupriavidus sp. P-10]BDB27234.1 hypothetical protein CTP10_R46390 [Cupriavidus sp. P-10]